VTAPIRIGPADVLVVVDLQNDFCPGGALAVPGGNSVVGPLNRIAHGFAHVVLTQDWHPPSHLSFASSHPGRKAFETIEAPYGVQELWPDHCVQQSWGAAFHADLAIPHAQLILRKGYRREIDSYSAFRENDRITRTGLAGYLRERGLKRVFLAGLAFDFCVRYSAEDAVSESFDVVVLGDCCRAIDLNGSAKATRQRLRALNVPLLASDAIARPQP
jgi:nicotinamidase/pyrazinamidase